MPSLRSWTASTIRAAGAWPSSARVRAAVWSLVSRGRRTSSAWRAVSSLARQWRIGRRGVQLVAPVGAGDQQRPAGQPGRQVGHHLQAQLVGPVEVLEHDQHRVPAADPPGFIGQVLDQQPPLPVPIAADPGELPQPPGHGLADLPQPGRSGLAQVAGQVQQQPPGGLDVAGEGRRPDHPERPPAGGLGDGGQQAGLADPGLAGHEQQVPSPGGGLGQAPVGQGQEVVAAHRDRRLQRAMTGQPCLPE